MTNKLLIQNIYIQHKKQMNKKTKIPTTLNKKIEILNVLKLDDKLMTCYAVSM